MKSANDMSSFFRRTVEKLKPYSATNRRRLWLWSWPGWRP